MTFSVRMFKGNMACEEWVLICANIQFIHSFNLLRAVVLGGSRLQKDRGGASITMGGAPLYAPPLHSQLFPDFFDLGLQ